ncbi:MAG: clan AA aspartic protease [Bacteroidetes bacterium]|nr:MAG: clan AA aspartic protease [Bacteroidota bacterium]
MAKNYKTPIIVEHIDGDGFHIFTEVKIGRKRYRALIDTGASKSVIDLQTAESIKKLEWVDNLATQAKGLGTEGMETKVARLPKLKIGELAIEDLYLGILDLSHITGMYHSLGIEPFSLILGGDILQEYDAVINYGKSSLTLKV